MSLRSLLILLPLISVVSSCALFSHSPEDPLHVALSTTVPEKFEKHFELSDVSTVVIPDAALALARTVRNQVELREGPGMAFQLKDEILPRDKALIILEQAKKWIKVLDPTRHTVGWVHQQTIKRIPSAGRTETVVLNALPKAFAVAPIKRIYDYKDGSPIDVNIPKGASFVRLREDKENSLVIIQQTASLAWINKRAIQ